MNTVRALAFSVVGALVVAGASLLALPAHAQATCSADTDCTADGTACGTSVCTMGSSNGAGPTACMPASQREGVCWKDSDCKCAPEGATCVGVQTGDILTNGRCTFTMLDGGLGVDGGGKDGGGSNGGGSDASSDGNATPDAGTGASDAGGADSGSSNGDSGTGSGGPGPTHGADAGNGGNPGAGSGSSSGSAPGGSSGGCALSGVDQESSTPGWFAVGLLGAAIALARGRRARGER
jgi:hypothetical protein